MSANPERKARLVEIRALCTDYSNPESHDKLEKVETKEIRQCLAWMVMTAGQGWKANPTVQTMKLILEQREASEREEHERKLARTSAWWGLGGVIVGAVITSVTQYLTSQSG